MIKIHQVKQGSPAWQTLREGKYTGSNADKLLKFGTIDYSRTEDSEWQGNFHTRRGHILEQEAIELYEQIKVIKVDRPGFVTNDKFPECGYSPDGLTEDRTIEVKAFEAEKHREAADTPPLKIKAQCHFGMVICDKKLCDLLLYNPDLPADEALIILTIRQNPLVKANFMRILGLKNGKS